MKKFFVSSTVLVLIAVLVSGAFASSITGSLPDGRVGERYGGARVSMLQYEGMFGTKTWSISNGELPPGLSFTSTNLVATHITGTPTRKGTYNFTVMVSVMNLDSGRTDRVTRDFTVTILDNPNVQNAEITGSFSNGTSGEPYSSSIYASNGTKPYSWQYSGELPPGLSLRADDDAYTLSGTPRTGGSYTFNVSLADYYGTVERTFTVEISAGGNNNNNNGGNSNNDNGGNNNNGNSGGNSNNGGNNNNNSDNDNGGSNNNVNNDNGNNNNNNGGNSNNDNGGNNNNGNSGGNSNNGGNNNNNSDNDNGGSNNNVNNDNGNNSNNNNGNTGNNNNETNGNGGNNGQNNNQPNGGASGGSGGGCSSGFGLFSLAAALFTLRKSRN